jgi:hypothetical protein
MARVHAGEPNGDLILGHTQPELPGCLRVNATGAPAPRDPELRLPPYSPARHARLAGKAGRARVRSPKFKVFGTSNPELPTSDPTRLVSLASLACRARPALHAPRSTTWLVIAVR